MQKAEKWAELELVWGAVWCLFLLRGALNLSQTISSLYKISIRSLYKRSITRQGLSKQSPETSRVSLMLQHLRDIVQRHLPPLL